MGVEFQLLQSQGESAVPERALTPHTLYTLQQQQQQQQQTDQETPGQDGFQDQAEFPRGQRGPPQQTDQHGVLRQLRLSLLELEKTVNQSLLDLHSKAGDKGDAHLCDFLEGNYLNEQVDGIKEIGDMITKIKRAGDGLGLHIIDKEMQA